MRWALSFRVVVNKKNIVFGFDLMQDIISPGKARHLGVSTPPPNNVRSRFNLPAARVTRGTGQESQALTFNYPLTRCYAGANSNSDSPVVLRLVVTWERP